MCVIILQIDIQIQVFDDLVKHAAVSYDLVSYFSNSIPREYRIVNAYLEFYHFSDKCSAAAKNVFEGGYQLRHRTLN